jgi:alpha-glucoside transport system substrate-binding protein
VTALQAHLSTPEAATAMARELGPGWLSPNSGLDPDALGDPLERLALDVLQDPRTTLRYDGSDRMPATVGASSLPRALTAWITGATSTDALAAAEAGWPR